MLSRFTTALLIASATITIPADAQSSTPTSINLQTQGRNVDFSGFSFTRPITTGTVLPSNCLPGQLFFNIAAIAGSNLYACTTLNTWTPQGQGNAGVSSVTWGALPAWLTGTVGDGSTTPSLTLNSASGQPAHQVLGTGAGSSFAPISLTAADLPSAITSNTTGTAENVIGTVAIANGGTGQTNAPAAFNALSPLTTVGDILYGAGSGVNSRLAGNTTTTKEFLTQAGTGSASAAPAWSTIMAADLPPSITSSTTGNAATATKLASIPTACEPGLYAISITATGNANCAQVSYSQLAGTPSVYNQTIQNSGVVQTQRSAINFKGGSNITLSVVDNPTNNSTDVTINASAPASNFPTVEVNGSAVGSAGTLNITQGSGVALTGSTTSGVTTVTVSMASATGGSVATGSTAPASGCNSSSDLGSFYEQTGATQALWRCSYNGSAYLWVPTSASFANVKDFGAKCDGTTVDTTAIQNAINASGVAAVFIPAGTCIISAPSSTSSAGMNLRSNLYLFGIPGQSILKLQNSNGPYSGIFKCLSCTNLVIENLVVDGNTANNAISNNAEVQSSGYVRTEFQLFGDTHIRVRGVTVQNSSSVNSLDCNTCADVDFEGNVFLGMGDDPNHVQHDASAIYVSGGASTPNTSSIISNNRFFAASAAAASYGATTAIELHMDNIIAANNQVWGYQGCMNVTGIDQQEDDAISVTGNSCEVQAFGLQIWSQTYAGHTSGYGINGLNISGNSIRVHQLNYPVGGGGGTVYGIGFNYAMNLPVRNVKIDSNTIVFDQENTARTASSFSSGIGYGASGTPVSLQNITVSNNLIDNAPVAGIKFSGNLNNIRILSNTITDAGSSLDTNMSSSYKVPVFVSSPNAIIGLDVKGNKILDDFATSRTATAFYLASGAGSADVHYTDNDVHLSGTNTSSWNSYFSLDANSYPVVNMNAAELSWTHPTGSYGSGSRVYDQTTNTTYFTVTAGNTWLSGFTGTKTSGACTFAINDGRITAVSGC